MNRIKFLLSTVMLAVLCSACNNNIEMSRFADKSKEEVLQIVFQESPKIENGQLNMSIRMGNGSYYNFYFKNIEEALSNQKFMAADVWEVDKRKRFSISIFQKVTSIQLFFENGKVVKYEIKTWAKT